MARKNTSSAAAKISAAKTTTAAVVTTPVRNSAVPPKSAVIATPAKKSWPTHDSIAIRAYFMWKNNGGSQTENWLRAEQDLNAA